MSRPRAFDEDEVVTAAKDLFWQQGYATTSIADLEDATGLSRSSLYMAFGTKRDLFAAALRLYVDTFIDPLLTPLESEQADLREIITFFKTLAALFKEPEGRRGCLMINTIGECAGRGIGFAREGEDFLERVRNAFGRALRNSVRTDVMTRRQAAQRAALLEGALVGAWITVRADPIAAREVCLSAAAHAESWSGEDP